MTRWMLKDRTKDWYDEMDTERLMALSPFSRGGDSGDVGTNGSPVGHRLASHTKTLKIIGFP